MLTNAVFALHVFL